MNEFYLVFGENGWVDDGEGEKGKGGSTHNGCESRKWLSARTRAAAGAAAYLPSAGSRSSR